MSNFENIRRYAEFNHEAGLDGGIDNHLDNIKNAAREEGAMEERNNFIRYIGWIVVITVGILEVGKWLFRVIKGFIDRCKAIKHETVMEKAEKSEAIIREGVKLAEEYEAEEKSSEEEPEEEQSYD